MSPTATVVVTGTDPARVRRCLGQLATLDLAPDEVIVVDASPDGHVTRVVEEGFASVRLVPRGSAPEADPTARQRGYALATRDVVAFLDDRCLVDAGWLGELLAPYDDPGVLGVGGRVVTGVEGEADAGVADVGRLLPDGRLTANFGADPGRPIEVDHLPSENMSFRRDALASLGNGARPSPDLDSGYAHLALGTSHPGRRLLFQPSAVVLRDAPSSRGAARRPTAPKDRYAARRDHMALLVRVFGWRDRIVTRYARSTLRAQADYARLFVWRLGPTHSSGFPRKWSKRAAAPLVFAHSVAEMAGVVAGVPTGIRARRQDKERTS